MKTLDILKGALLTGCLLGTPLVFAQVDSAEQLPNRSTDTQTMEQQQQEFQEADKDSSGTLNEEEAQEVGVKEFADADTNSDGELNLSEFYIAKDTSRR